MEYRRDWRNLLLAAAVAALLVSGAKAQQQTAGPSAVQTLRISAGDLIELTVFDCPEFSGRLRVSPAGDVAVPVTGAVRVAGLTAEDAAATIEQVFRSQDVLLKPHASVFIVEYATQGVTLTGEVKTPGIYPLLGSHTVVDVVSAAGGVSMRAGRLVTVTHRTDPEHPVIARLDNEPGSVAAKLDILPGDTIAVSRAGIVYVIGEVGKPGGFVIEDEDLTALQALALAQGPSKTAAQNRARLIRKSSTGRVETELPLKKMIAGKVGDVPVRDGDIIFVPSSGAKTWTNRSIEAAITVTTGLAIYGRL